VLLVSWQGDITKKTLDYLLPHPKYFKQDTGVGYISNEIFSRQLVIVGKQGSGKTTFSRFVGLEGYKRYQREGYAVSVVESTSLESLLYDGVTDVDVNILILQDATKASFEKDTLRQVYQIRQLVLDRTSQPYGLILLVMETHRFHDLDKSLRACFDIVAFLSLPNNPYDMGVARRYLGRKGLLMLARYEPKKIIAYNRRYSVAYFYGNCGWFIVEPPERNIARKL